MFVPPYNAVLRAIGTSPEEFPNQVEVTVSAKFFKFLLQFAVEHGDFNEKGYLAANPDVEQALKEKKIASAREHYNKSGYWECRRGATPEVDETWYKKVNPDVSAAIRRKAVASAAEHYLLTGVEEFRPPNEAVQDDVWTWKSLAVRKPRMRA
jgi:hypothetical protein